MTVITIAGQTCSGKTTLEAELNKLGVGKVVSHTTRAPRLGEINGVDYHFISDAEYDRMLAAGEFVETVRFGAARYSISAHSMHSALMDFEHVAVVAEPDGTEQIVRWCRGNNMGTFSVWLHVDPLAQARRYTDRLLTDLVFNLSDNGMAKVAAVGAGRLAEMLGTEQRWARSATIGLINSNEWYGWKLSGKDLPAVVARELLDRVNAQTRNLQ